MKVAKFADLSTHLKEAKHASLYLLVCKDDSERKEAERSLLQALVPQGGSREHTLRAFSADKNKIGEILDELFSFSFFASKRVIFLTEAEKLTKEETAKLESCFASPNPSITLLISANAINRATTFYKKCEQAGIVIDIEEEKAWEKETSLSLKVQQWVTEQDKTIDPQTARFLIQYAGTDQQILRSEIDKLITFAGDRAAVTQADIKAICSGTPTETAWQLGDALFKKDGAAALRIIKGLIQESQDFFSIIRQIRFQFQTKLQISSILIEGGTSADVQTKFPYMRGTILQQNVQLSQNYGHSALVKGILAIDSTELQAKNSSIGTDLLIEKLIFKLVI